MSTQIQGLDTNLFAKAIATMYSSAIRGSGGKRSAEEAIQREIAPAIVILAPYNEDIKKLEAKLSPDIVQATKAKLGLS